MENFKTPVAGGLRAARKRIALMLALMMLGAFPAHGTQAQTSPPNQANPSPTNIANIPAPAAANSPANKATPQNGTAPAYNPGEPLFIDSQKILQNQQAQQQQQQNAQSQQAQEPEALAPEEVLTAEIQLLNRRMSLCEGVSACSTRDRLQILTDASNALHESLMRISTVCTIMSADSCLSQQYAQLQQWSALNGRMVPMMQSVATDAGNAQELLISQAAPSPSTASALNDMAPAAGGPVIVTHTVVPKP